MFLKFQVAHRDSQFELHDYREFIGRPALRFGFDCPQLQGRYNRGDVNLQHNACSFIFGGRDGRARLWDLRNTGKCTQEVRKFPMLLLSITLVTLSRIDTVFLWTEDRAKSL